MSDIERRALFDGKTFDQTKDGKRLKTNLDKVFDLMRDGNKRTLQQISKAVGCSESGASARLRDFRKSKFAEYGVSKVNSKRESGGTWLYWIELT